MVKENLELDRALLPVRLFSRGDLEAFPIRHGKAKPMTDSEMSSIRVSPGFPGSGRLRAYGWTPLSQEELEKMVKEYPRLRKSNSDMLEVAKLRFSDSYRRDNRTDRAIDLIIALDSLLSEGADSIRYKVALRTAMLLETKGTERQNTFNRIYAVYGHRNKVLHGDTSPKKRKDAREWFKNKVYQLLDDVKRILLYFMQRDLSRQTLNPAKIEDHLFENGILGLDLPEGS